MGPGIRVDASKAGERDSALAVSTETAVERFATWLARLDDPED